MPAEEFVRRLAAAKTKPLALVSQGEDVLEALKCERSKDYARAVKKEKPSVECR
jgi:hypothetical protein